MFVSYYDEKSKTMIIMAKGALDKSEASLFSACYLKRSLEPKLFILDCKETYYIDSSMTGVFFSFCQYADQCHAKIYITNMNDKILEEFRLLHFHKIFQPMFNKESFRIEWVYYPKKNNKSTHGD